MEVRFKKRSLRKRYHLNPREARRMNKKQHIHTFYNGCCDNEGPSRLQSLEQEGHQTSSPVQVASQGDDRQGTQKDAIPSSPSPAPSPALIRTPVMSHPLFSNVTKPRELNRLGIDTSSSKEGRRGFTPLLLRTVKWS